MIRIKESGDLDQNDETERSSGVKMKRVTIMVLIVIVLAGMGAVIGTKIVQQNHVRHLLELGNQYLREERYEEAIAAFTSVLDIEKKCGDAYIGLVDSYVGSKDIKAAMDYAEKGYVVCNDDKRLKEKFIQTGIKSTGQKFDKGQYMDGLTQMDRLLKYFAENKRVLDALTMYLNEYMDGLRKENDYETMQKLVDKYSKYKVTIDFGALQVEIDKWREYYTRLSEHLLSIAKACSERSFENVFELMRDVKYIELINQFGNANEIHAYDTGYGLLGVYKVQSEQYGNYMIYYGDYADEIREGKGLWIGYYDGNNYIADGIWEKDKPNGSFQVREWCDKLSEEVVYRVIDGSAVDGVWNGDVNWSFETEGGKFTFPVEFNHGKWVLKRYVEDEDKYVVCEANQAVGTDSSMQIDASEKDIVEGIIGFE